MHSFYTWPHSTEQSAERLIDVGFYYSGKHFQHKKVFIIGNSNPCKNQLMVLCYRKQRSSNVFHCGLTLSDCISLLHTKKVVLDSVEISKCFPLSLQSVLNALNLAC